MHVGAPVDLSIVLPFADHEEVVGAACRRLARHVRELELSFEIVAVDEGSTDNSPAILSLLRREVPELRIATVPGGRRAGYRVGAGLARGRVLLLIAPGSATATLAPVGRAFRRVFRGELDVVVVEGRFAVAHRTRCLPALRGRRHSAFHGLARRARVAGLAVETYELGGSSGTAGRRVGDGRLFRWLGALTPARLVR
jgi:hypothetical protein